MIEYAVLYDYFGEGYIEIWGEHLATATRIAGGNHIDNGVSRTVVYRKDGGPWLEFHKKEPVSAVRRCYDWALVRITSALIAIRPHRKSTRA